MATTLKSHAEKMELFIPLEPVAPIPLEYAEPDPVKREEAWKRFLAFARTRKSDDAAPTGTRDDWYNEAIEEPSR